MLSFADPIYYPVKSSILVDYLTYAFLMGMSPLLGNSHYEDI
jgi:hypothetical protein